MDGIRRALPKCRQRLSCEVTPRVLYQDVVDVFVGGPARFDRAGAACHERALLRAPVAIRGAGVGGGAGSAGWWGLLARGLIGARDGAR